MGVIRWVLSASLVLCPLYPISPAVSPVLEETSIANEYYSILNLTEIQYKAFAFALNGFAKIQEFSPALNDTILTIIDYSLPSDKERLFVVDLKNKKILYKSLVAHGTETGALYARYFSNRLQSHQSSLGFFITGNTYYGKHGYSLRLSGIEKGINDNARKRAIVFHAASYVSTTFIEKHGRLGRSFGCPALPVNMNEPIIDIIKNKSCVFIFYPDETYLAQSVFLNSRTDTL